MSGQFSMLICISRLDQEKKNKTVSAKKVIVMNLSLVQTEKSLLLAKNETDSIWKNLWLPFDSEIYKKLHQKFSSSQLRKNIKHELTP
jgi:hypothetical protein